jgi:hypothetical protein
MKMKQCLVIMLCCLLPSLLCAEPNNRDGFFLRLTAGIGHGVDKQSQYEPNEEQWFDGSAYAGDLAIGGMITENLALHLSVYNGSLINPTYQPSGVATGSNSNETYVIKAGGGGLGLTYYFMPINIYLSAASGLGIRETERTIGNTVTTDSSETGLSWQFAVGKEWWVSSEWSLGFGAQFIYVRVPVSVSACTGCFRNQDTTFSALVFSATYN